MSQITTTISPFTKTPSRQNPLTFSEDMDVRLSEENSRIEQMNSVSAEMNAVSNEINASETAVQRIKDDVIDLNNDIDSKKSQIDDKYTEIMSYTIPTEATYNEDTIDAKVRMSQVLNITNSI
jgi:predicted  nucleic acid-binding Zn-ribbon protein